MTQRLFVQTQEQWDRKWNEAPPCDRCIDVTLEDFPAVYVPSENTYYIPAWQFDRLDIHIDPAVSASAKEKV